MIRSLPTRLLLALGLSWLVLTTGSVQAAPSYYLAIAEDNNVAHMTAAAKAPGASAASIEALHMAEMNAMWQTQQELLAFRDYPYFEITNTSTDTTSAITHFRIAIDPSRAYNFDTVFYVQSSPGITYAINGLDTAQGGVRSDFIDLTFTGFTKDKYFRFRSDIDNDSGNVNFFTDYREVLTDAGGKFPASTNALVTVDISGMTFSSRIPGGQLMGPFMTGTAPQVQHAQDMVQPYVMGGVAAIPEPTTWMSLGTLASVMGVVFYRRRKLDPQS